MKQEKITLDDLFEKEFVVEEDKDENHNNV